MPQMRWYAEYLGQVRAGFREAIRRKDPIGGNWTFLLLTIAASLCGLAKMKLAGVFHSESRRYRDWSSLIDDATSLATTSVPEGIWLEFGVAGGTSINYVARNTGHEIWGFDSFAGLPRRWIGPFNKGSFSTGGSLPNVEPNVRLVKGWFSDTLPPFLKGLGKRQVAFLHIDSDLYESAAFVLDQLERFVSAGTVIVFDEFCSAIPDDEELAFLRVVRRMHWTFRFIGYAARGTASLPVSVQLTSP